MDNSKFLIVVVIYECVIEESITFKKLLAIREKVCSFPEILIYDNSHNSQFSVKYLQSVAFYKHNQANGGVAGAYNYALSLGKIERKEWLILFDQDTDLSLDFFERLERSLLLYPQQELFCPIVLSAGKIVSPTYYLLEKAIKPKRLNTGLVNSLYYTVINSGLTIKLGLMESLGGYDDDLPLDLSDHNFFRKYKKENKKFVLTEVVNLHDLSSESDTSFEKVYGRFKKYYSSSLIYSHKIHNPFPLFWLCLRAIKLTFKFNTFEFVKFLFVKK